MSSRRAQRRREQRTCARKLRHPDQQAASAALIHMDRRDGDTWPMHAYRCTTCAGWHTGHVRGRRRG